MNIVTGCSGVDAIAYAATLLDIEVIGQIELDKFCNQILELRYPGVKRLENVFDVRGDEFGAVDIFAFGDPCQPHSVAGKQKGTADDRYIWPELYRIIQTMRPPWIINENVIGSVSNGVVRDKIMQLESEGYRARAYTVPACAVGAPHERQRVFVVAHAAVSQWESRTEKQRVLREVYGNKREFNNINRPSETCMDGYSGIEVVGNTECERRTRENNIKESTLPTESSQFMADTSSSGWEEFHFTEITTGNGYDTGCSNASGGARSTQPGMGGNANGISSRLHGSGGQEDSNGIFETFETIFTATLKQILWPAGYGAEQYDYEPPRVAVGVKNRTNRLKALGNSIVWQQIFPILLAIKLIERCEVK